ncbi:hypothetical protein KIN20_003097 [Parelaphostrongylus tenuis]|uniref:NIDO domain-containing protein n=1 Tax=Parelaphostrongylus tenuis TaxID=148309 RepID=A0AAD5MF63_PARTN|nr:hypothetical protein KIN20_003097 [Parelaphostrongylus tenuis]
MGMISFEPPPFTTPPWTFPNPSWPKQRDHAFIAPFYADAMYQWIGNTKISNTFYRSVHRPRLDDDEMYNTNPLANTGITQDQNLYGQQQPQFRTQFGQTPNINPLFGQQQQQYGQSSIYGQQYNYQQVRKKRQMPGRVSQPGMVVDPLLLDKITQDVQDGYTGANGWRAEHAFIVTWYRMAYGGAPRALDVSQFEHVKDWQNTFQLVVATDEIRQPRANTLAEWLNDSALAQKII